MKRGKRGKSDGSREAREAKPVTPGPPRPGPEARTRGPQDAPKLRGYQRECLETILARYKDGCRRQLVCLPTGTGKTVIFAGFPAFFRMRKRMLVLAHREELLDQAREKILRASPKLKVEVEQAARKASPESQVVVASVPTLGRKGSKRLSRLDPDEFYLIVVDEAHHSTAATYRRVLEHFGVFEEDTRKLLVGFTATPKRGDGEGLDQVFQEITFARSLPGMIREKWLSPVAGYRIETDVDLSRVRTRMGDFVTSQLSNAVNVKARNDLVVKIHKDRLAGRQTLCFCVDVAHTKGLARSFKKAGVPVAAVTGDTEPAARKRALVSFRAGRAKVLTNCMVLTEGYDEPSVAGIILARPTKSTLLYTQMIGRGTRLHPGKENVLVIDIVDVTKGHRLVTLPGLFGLSSGFDLEGRTTDEVERAREWVEGNRPWVRVDAATSLSDLRYRCTRIDLLELDLPEELYDCAGFAWTAVARDTYRLCLAERESLVVAPTILGTWEVVLRGGGTKQGGGAETPVGAADKASSAIRLAEEFVRTKRQSSVGLVLRGTKWRGERASDRQLALIRKRGVAPPDGLTKGQASHLIAMLVPGRGRKRSAGAAPGEGR